MTMNGFGLRIRGYRQRVREHLPNAVAVSPVRRLVGTVRAMTVLAVLDANDWLIGRFAPDLPARWDPSIFPWTRRVAACSEAIRGEMVAYLDRRIIPETAEIIGLDPESAEARANVPADVGAWRSLILFWFGEEIETNTTHFPAAMELLRSIPNVNSMGFTALDPGAHIAEHRGPNRGAIRFQLPIIVPGPHGACRIRVDDEMVRWREGEPVVFDLSVPHEAWNDSDEVRVLLMIELPTPLPFPLSVSNRLAQAAYRHFPSFDKVPERVRTMATGSDYETVAA